VTNESHRWRLRPEEAVTRTVPTSEALVEGLRGVGVHRMSREETAAWNALDEEEREEARRAIREAVLEQGGGELRDATGKLVEVVTGRVR
jgi:hypothetical protein